MIESYTISEWIAFFFIYSFLGWCVESTIVSVSRRKLINRGFQKGPMLPLYGSGAVVVLLSTLWVKDSIILVYLVGLISATVLEYITGAAMEGIFNMRYWDYSKRRFNIHGYVCLKSSLFWGVLTVVLVCYLHVEVAALVASVQPNILRIALIIVACVATVDFAYSFKKAIDFQKLLIYETMIRRQLSEITERFNEAKEAFVELSTEKQKEYFAKQEETIETLRADLDIAKTKIGKFKNSMMTSFPSSTSSKFGEALQEFKDRFSIGK